MLLCGVGTHGNEVHYYKEKYQLIRNIFICKNDKSIVDQTLTGPVLIKFTHCKAIVDNVQYDAVERLGTELKSGKNDYELRMEEMKTKIQINKIQWGTTIHTTTTYTMLGILLIVVFVVACGKEYNNFYTRDYTTCTLHINHSFTCYGSSNFIPAVDGSSV